MAREALEGNTRAAPLRARGDGVPAWPHGWQRAQQLCKGRPRRPKVPHDLGRRPLLPLAVLIQRVLPFQRPRCELAELSVVKLVSGVLRQHVEKVARRHSRDVQIGRENLFQRQWGLRKGRARSSAAAFRAQHRNLNKCRQFQAQRLDDKARDQLGVGLGPHHQDIAGTITSGRRQLKADVAHVLLLLGMLLRAETPISPHAGHKLLGILEGGATRRECRRCGCLTNNIEAVTAIVQIRDLSG
mmetsp:Transcript_57312/g.147861  ORF Transcript_57312/g.147861 Transcript_57312/m.147861 type:complete len:243 (+) Transcript_57312:834-1562(+)